MKRIARYITCLCTVCLALCFGSCELESYDNGDLDGYWQLNQLDSIQQQKSVDMVPQKIFWSVEGKLLEMKNLSKTGVPRIYMRFNHEGDRLTLSDPHRYTEPSTPVDQKDPAIGTVDSLRLYGINALTEEFKVLELSGSRMAIESKTLRLHFVKF